jgi:PBP1b-binding outer membrane lipoprotein LpoB
MKWYKQAIGILAAALLFSGCSSPSGTQSVVSNPPTQSIQPASSTPEEEPVPVTSESEIRTINVGDTIITEKKEITIKYVELAYEVEPHNSTNMFAAGLAAKEGKIFIDLCVDVKNLQKQALNSGNVMDVTANYNDGFTYKATDMVEDSTLGLTSLANLTGVSIDPLETREMRYLMDCPQEVDENTDSPLFLLLAVEGTEYQLTIR